MCKTTFSLSGGTHLLKLSLVHFYILHQFIMYCTSSVYIRFETFEILKPGKELSQSYPNLYHFSYHWDSLSQPYRSSGNPRRRLSRILLR